MCVPCSEDGRLPGRLDIVVLPVFGAGSETELGFEVSLRTVEADV